MSEREVRARIVRAWYEPARWRFLAFESAVVQHLRRALASGELANVQVESRTKSVDSFVAKALTADPVNPAGFKYSHPETEIVDAVGARMIVPLSTDVAPVRDLLHERYVVEEEEARGAADQLEVPGYQSLHLLLRLRKHERGAPEFKDMADMVVEVQVRTILQHAWASLQHDLAYKTDRPPTPSLKRRLTALAGVLELADREFIQVREAHGDVEPIVAVGSASRGEKLTPTSVRKLVGNVVGGAEETDQIWFDALTSVLGELELHNVGDVLRSLAGWERRAEAVTAAVRETRPYANAVYVFDAMLRLGMGEQYFARRLEHANVDQHPTARREFDRERGGLVRAVAALVD